VYHPLDLTDGIYVTNVDHSFKLTAQGDPSSCNVTVQPNHSITISGRIVPLANGNVELGGLHCSLN
jgi:hypothetical protein